MTDSTAHLLISSAGMVVACACLALSFRAHRAERPGWGVLWLLTGALAVRAVAASVGFVYPWDERYHALVAKHLLLHPLLPTLYETPLVAYDFRDWPTNHIWLHKPPLPLWMIAGAYSLFGVAPWVTRVPSIVLGTLGVWLTFRLAHDWFGPRAAWFAAFLHAVSGFFISHESGLLQTDHPDVALAVFTELAIFCGWRHVQTSRARWLIALGAAAGAAVLSKWLVGLVAFPVYAALCLGRRPLWQIARDGALALAVCIAMFLPWSFYTRQLYPAEFAWEQVFNALHILKPLDGHGGGPLFHFGWAFPLYGQLAPLLVILFLVRSRPRLALLAWLALPYLFFSYVATKMTGYVLFAAPAVFIMEAAALAHILDSGWLTARWRVGFVTLCLFVAARAGTEGLRPFTPETRYQAWVQPLHTLVASLGTAPCVVFGEPHAIEAMLESPHTFYVRLPSLDDVARLTAQGYRVIVMSDAPLPAELIGDPRVQRM